MVGRFHHLSAKNPKFPDELHRHLQADSGLPSLHKSLIPYLEQATNLVQTTYPPNLSKRERGGCRGRDGETKAAASSPQRQQHVPEEPACSCMIDFTCDAAACRGGCVMRTKQTTSQFSATTEAAAVCVVEPGTVSNISGNYCTCLYLQDGGTSSLASCKCQSDMALQANS